MKKLWDLAWAIYRKHEEGMNYLIWGFIAFCLSVFLYWLFEGVMGWNPVVANSVDWVLCVIFTFLTNKFLVFKSPWGSAKENLREFVSFIAARVFTLVLEDAIIWGLDTKLGWNSMLVKLIGQAVVIITNYVLSKLFIFKKEQ